MSEGLPSFHFSDKAEALSADAPRPIGVEEMAKALGAGKRTDPRVFEISVEGAVKAHGYTPAEVESLLKHYRDHMITFSKSMQALQAGADEYRPGGYS